jgi:hypothetical protein
VLMRVIKMDWLWGVMIKMKYKCEYNSNPLAVLDEGWGEWNDVIKGDNKDE